jgi:hypothetical protein
MGRIRAEGPLESADFEGEPRASGGSWWGWKLEKMALEWLYRRGKLAISERRSFRRVYDLAERIYPPGPTAAKRDYEDSWLLAGLAANGVAPERHLAGYLTAPRLPAPLRREVIARGLRRRRIVEVEVPGLKGPCFALPEMLDALPRLPPPRGTTLLCPFDSLLWQRMRAEELLDFRFRIEMYVPRLQRRFGYYVLPVLHEGRLVARLDVQRERASGRLHVHAMLLEKGFAPDAGFRRGLADCLTEMAAWLGADHLELPEPWRDLV